jgi:hypothetical protein
MTKQRRTFRHILQGVASCNATALETRARQANWLAHTETKQTKRFFAIKTFAISKLFQVPKFEPIIQSCRYTPQGPLLSIRLKSWGQLHVPLNSLTASARKYVLEPRTRNRQEIPFTNVSGGHGGYYAHAYRQAHAQAGIHPNPITHKGGDLKLSA